MRRRFLLLVLIGSLLVNCQPSLGQQRRQVDRLFHSFSTLEQLRVEGYGNQEWCKYITYRRGRFSSNLESQTCNLFHGTVQPFDAQAQQDFKQVERAIAAANIKIHRIRELMLAPTIEPFGASFAFEGRGFLGSLSQYVYVPAYKALPQMILTEPLRQLIKTGTRFALIGIRRLPFPFGASLPLRSPDRLPHL